MTTPDLTPQLAARYAAVALENIEREFPNAPQHVVTDAGEHVRPRMLHPAFYGSFDWHSCVHMHWSLVRLLRHFPSAPFAGEVRSALDRHLTVDALRVEADYIATHPTFERPYGWGWALQLAAEVAPFPGWRDAVAPLADAVVARFHDWLPRATYPVRHGIHANSAFGLLLSLRYSEAPLADEVRAAALRWFGDDVSYPAQFEPSGEDFLSPVLTEAALMARVLPPDAFASWFTEFLPAVPGELSTPVEVTDRSDYRIVHLDGLNLSRAWCFGILAQHLPAEAASLAEWRRAHLDAALPHVARGDYGGDHWLASFALLALTG